MLDHEFKEWLISALVLISKQLNNVQRKLDTLLEASTSVSTEQLAELKKDSLQLNAATSSLAQAIEQQKQKG